MLPLRQLQQHNKVIKSDSFACYLRWHLSIIQFVSSQLTEVLITPSFSHLASSKTVHKVKSIISAALIFPRAVDPVAFYHLPWIWNSSCRLHSWLHNCRLPFATWIVGRCNRGLVAKGKQGNEKPCLISCLLQPLWGFKAQNVSLVIHIAQPLDSNRKPNTKLLFFFLFFCRPPGSCVLKRACEWAHYARNHAFHNFLLSLARWQGLEVSFGRVTLIVMIRGLISAEEIK